MTQVIAPGAKVLIRDAEWLVRRVDRTSTGGQVLRVVGLSELVRDKEATFLEEIERSVEVLDPAATRLVSDDSPNYRTSLLYMEALLRQAPPTDERLYVGHRAAMDLVPYQLDPALQALEQPRQRILIADAVGLGKTLEAGILMSELIKRGKGKRILVVALKSMLTQFQKEMWSRFTIPLVRLDSAGIQRIRRDLPTNHNPFYRYDRTIISIDTLKQDAEYRTFIENAHWDIIVLDEAQNVADRGTRSLRTKLARLLARRSDTLIMLSATPHDGKARSFASLMNMLDHTAIADPENYGPEDIQGLFIRRFKKDIQDQVSTAFQHREIGVVRATASEAEEHVHGQLADLKFGRLDARRGGSHLFKTTLSKALFSSPMACAETIRNRIQRLERREDVEDYRSDIDALHTLLRDVDKVGPTRFSKYQRLLGLLQDKHAAFAWDASDPKDRLVVFTERIETLRFLASQLKDDLELDDEQVAILHGSMSDVDQQRVVEEFGREQAAVRLLVASDVASEGINLHYLSHRLVHFDVPWSLMVFQQRNGRIDRYGQEQKPLIRYLVTESQVPKIRGDTRILEVLVEKDKQAAENIGDPRALMGVYDVEEEERITARAMEEGRTAEAFESELEPKDLPFDPLRLLMGEDPPPTGGSAVQRTASMPSLFPSDFSYLCSALEHLDTRQTIQFTCYGDEERVDLTAPEDLAERFELLPPEAFPEQGSFILSGRKDEIQREIRSARQNEATWPRRQYLWELHPVVQWVNDKVLAAFGRHEAPVLALSHGLEAGETVLLLSGVVPNRKGQPLVHRWFGARFEGEDFRSIEELPSLLDRTALGRRSIPNPTRLMDDEILQGLLRRAVDEGRAWMLHRRQEFEERINEKLNAELRGLERLRERQVRQLDLRFDDDLSPAERQGKDERRREIDRIFDDYLEWVQDTMTTEDRPYLQVVAALIHAH
ncbi:MAG: DEAD/DEAH box helicase [Gemmatimonadota bacterium]